MPLNLAAAVNIAQPIEADCFEVIAFTVNVNPSDVADQQLQLTYAAGNMVNGAFSQVGGNRGTSLNSAQLQTFLAANPALYATLKPILYGLIQAQEGVTGTTS